MNRRGLKQTARLAQGGERFVGVEVVVHAVHLTRSRLSSGTGHHVVEGLTDRSATQLVNDCVLAHATGA